MNFRHLPFLLLFATGISASAQTNFSGLNYQAVVRNAVGDPVANQAVNLRLHIQEGLITGYVETHGATTDAHGQVSVVWGQGTPVGGSFWPTFADVPWSSGGTKTYQVYVDIAGVGNYAFLGSGQFKSVPFALHALTSGGGSAVGWSLTGNDLSNTNAGNVGINTTTPIAPLTVGGGQYGIIHKQGPVELGTFIAPECGDTAAAWFGTKSNHAMKFFTGNGCATMTLHTNGNVGIGTTTPDERLVVTGGNALVKGVNGFVAGGDQGVLYLGDQNSYIKNTFGGGVSVGSYGGPDALYVQSFGNVGVGTTDPQAKLHVAGAVKIADGSQGAGKVLTSDANGLATWTTPSSSGGTGWALIGNNLSNTNSGNVGINASNPISKLHINQSSSVFGNEYAQHAFQIGGFLDNDMQLIAGVDNTAGVAYIKSIKRGILPWNLALNVSGGNVGIGTANPQSKLAVNGTITCKEVNVTLAGFPDYVFEKDYHLMPLGEVEEYIAANGHLPNVPSACEVEESGIGLGDLNKILLEKIEELTLHMIEKDQQILELRGDLSRLMDRTEVLLQNTTK